MLTLTHLLEEAKCYESVRAQRWPEGIVRCPKCSSDEVVKRGKMTPTLTASATAAKAAIASSTT